MISPNTIKTRHTKVKSTLTKYAMHTEKHVLRIYFGDVATGEGGAEPSQIGRVKFVPANRARYKFALVHADGTQSVIDNERIIAIKDITTGIIAYVNPASKRGNFQVR